MKDGVRGTDLMKRPEMNYETVTKLAPPEVPVPQDVAEQVEIQVKYEGYIEKSLQQVEKLKKMENKKFQTELIMTQLRGLRPRRVKN